MFSKKLILSILGCLSVVAAVPAADTNDLPYPVAPFRASYQETPDSEPIMLEGDVHDKVQKLRARAGLSEFSPAALPEIRSELVERTQQNTFCCKDIGQPWNYAWAGCTHSAAINLSVLKDVYVEPRSCVLAHCYGEADIWVCNDNDHQIHPEAGYIAKMAVSIELTCVQTNDSHKRFSCGQQFDSQNYNVILRRTGVQNTCPTGKDKDCSAWSY
ncbi:hypothetical protein GLAREA_05265 [Glarea lozoyensis ATCC 20868]|uniref:Uncharacterized protein n=2 Tax=Glarea lozoyensis TaxID=101852 RepID=S3DBX3_GLAL2|nr:uncharacterized protein GLAREA_05265 [Glarea lozoyensis ATCC 20868]EHK98015.1 hypothetical protein M7I_6250 [Glarea lozoyensis 74030]EPE35927.1 hypothetical protein GLAREA_05265 [Glarea lozoyensis ATCC 20868]